MPIQTDKEIGVSNRPGTYFFLQKGIQYFFENSKKALAWSNQYRDLVRNQESMENENSNCSEDHSLGCSWALQAGNLEKTRSEIPSNIRTSQSYRKSSPLELFAYLGGLYIYASSDPAALYKLIDWTPHHKWKVHKT